MNFGTHHSNYPQYSVGAPDPGYRKHDPATTVATPLNHDEAPAVSFIRSASPQKPYTTWAEQYHFPPSTNFPYQFDPAWNTTFATDTQPPMLTPAPIMHPVSIPQDIQVSAPAKLEPQTLSLSPSPPATGQQINLEIRQQQPLALIRVPKEGAGRHLEIQFVCHANNCGRVFKRAEHLRRHIRCVHSLDRPYACPVKDCGKRFSRSDNLNQHIKTHKSYFPELAAHQQQTGQAVQVGEQYQQNSTPQVSITPNPVAGHHTHIHHQNQQFHNFNFHHPSTPSSTK